MWKIFNYIKKSLTNTPTKRKAVDSYNLDITSPDATISQKDLALISFFLNYTPSKENLFCIIKKWSDDVFVNLSCESNTQNWLSSSKNMLTVDEMLNDKDQDCLKDFLWLIVGEEKYDVNDSLNDVVNFINNSKKEFQSTCSKTSKIYFSKYSDVNSYTIIWGQEDYINYILYNLG